MYNNKFVCCIKADGNVLREFKDTVYVPFGSEYSILLKNLNSVRALVNISIDGQDVVDGGLVINSNSEIELERFVKDLNKGNRFKFIERTGGVEKYRGIRVDDGLIRVEFKYEKRLPQFDWNEANKWKIGTATPGIYPNTPMWNSTWNTTGSPLFRGAYATSSVADSSTPQFMNCSTAYDTSSSHTTDSCDVVANNVGITAPGSVSSQQFQTVSSFLTESETFVMVFHMLGAPDATVGQKPITVKHKPKCSMCGKVNKATAKFCSDCGCGLTIV